MTSGYSDTPLAKKLGIKPGFKIWVLDTPKPYGDFFQAFPNDVKVLDTPSEPVDFIHIFAATLAVLNAHLNAAKPALKMNGTLWISWPKKASSLPSEIGKFDVMKAGQAAGLVDVKVAAIDEDWSGHKFVYRVIDR